MKKYLLLFGLLFLWHPAPAHAQWLFPSGARCSNVNAGTGSTVSCTVSNTLGRAQIVAIKWCDTDTTCTVDTSADTVSITDTVGNTYALDKRLDSASGTDRRGMAVYHAQNIGANVSNTVQLSITSANAVTLAGLIVTEVSGGTAAFITDASGTTDLAATASPVTVSTSGVTARGNEFVYTWVNIDSGILAVGQPITGGMGTNYPNSQLGASVIPGSGSAAIDQWNNAAPKTYIKIETMSFNTTGLTLNPTAQQRGIIVTYYSPAQLAPTSLTFANQAVSTTSATQTITFTNTGTGNIHLNSNAVLTGPNAADFSVSGSTCVNGLNVGNGPPAVTCSIVVSFTPSATGTRTATITLNTSATGSPHTMTVTGTGI